MSPSLIESAFSIHFSRAESKVIDENELAHFFIPQVIMCSNVSGDVIANVSIFHRQHSRVRTTNASRTLPSKRVHCSDDSKRPFIIFPLTSPIPRRHLWAAASFTASAVSGSDIPFILYSSPETGIDHPDVEANAEGLVTLLFGNSPRHLVSFVVNALNSARHARVDHKILVSRYIHRWTDQCVGGINLVIGSGKASGLEPSETSVDCTNLWILTDLNSLNWADENEWRDVLSSATVQYMVAEHVLEHLEWHEAHAALSNAAASLEKSLNTYVPETSVPRLRLAVPDTGRVGMFTGGGSVGSLDSDIRDRHKTRYDAASLCGLLQASGLDGFLLEWSYPLQFSARVENAFGGLSTGVSSTINLEFYSVSRSHRFNETEGKIRRSSNG